MAALVYGTITPGASQAQPAPSSPPAVANQVAAVTLARGLRSTSVFGRGDLTPVDPTTTFISTDVPYAIIRVNGYAPNTIVTLHLVDPTGATYSVDARSPQRTREHFEFAAPLYILGTDLENHTGTWHFQTMIGGQVQRDTAFQWTPATALSLPQIKELVDQTPMNAGLHWRYGAALAQLGRDSSAIAELQNAIRLDPKYALYHITLGRLYELQGRAVDAVREFQAALSIKGSFYDPVFTGWAQEHLRRLKEH